MKKKVLTKRELAKIIASYSDNLTPFSAIEVVDAVFNEIKEVVANGGELRLRGFGTLCSEFRKNKKGHDFHGNRVVDIPSRMKPKFKSSKKFASMCNHNY